MSDLSKYREVYGEAKRLESLLGGLQETVRNLTAELGPLEHEALKAEIAGETSAPAMKADFMEKKTGLRKAGLDLEEAKKRLRACQEILPGFRSKAADELRDVHRKGFERDLKAFANALKAALAAERTLVRTREEIFDEFNKIDVPCPFVPWAPIMMRKGHLINSERGWEKFILRMRDEGFEVDMK